MVRIIYVHSSTAMNQGVAGAWFESITDVGRHIHTNFTAKR